MSGDAPETPPALDVEALMNDLRERIGEKKAEGLYAVDDLAADLNVAGDPWDAAQLERAQLVSKVTPGLVTSPSESPIVGKALERVKQQIVRATWRNMADLADQLNAFHEELTAYSTSLGIEVQRLRGDLREVQAGQDGGGLAALDQRVSRLSDGASEGEPSASGPDPAFLPPLAEPPGLAPTVARELAVGADEIGLLLGCGTGELLDALGTGATGVDDRAGLVAAASRSGRRCLALDPREYLEGLPAASVSRILLRDLPESKSLAYNDQLLKACRRVLRDDGMIGVISRNFGSAAEREVFWQDPWRLRPVETGTIDALLRTADFSPSAPLWVGADADASPSDASCAVTLARVA